MKKSKKIEPKYRVYTHGRDYCAELINESWRAVVHKSDNDFVVENYDEKPDQFVDSEFLTQDQIYDQDMGILISDDLETKFILEGSETIFEAADRLLDAIKVFLSLIDQGSEIIEAIKDGSAPLIYFLKPYDPDEDNEDDNHNS